jgi:hypothetical protein
MIRPALALVTLVAAMAVAAAPAQARLAYGVIGGSALFSFNTNNPAGTASPFIPITGRQPNEAVVGIDVQPSTGQMYALTVSAADFSGRLYTLNVQTGALTPVGNGPISEALPAAANYGFDFNPVSGLIRVVGANGQNFELNPANAQVTPHPALNGGATGANAAAYSNPYEGATTTTLFDISPGGSLFTQQLVPDTGTLTLIGPLGVATDFVAFDIGVDNTAFAMVAGQFSNSSLYTVNTATGAATPVGALGAVISPFALAPPLQATPHSVSFAPESVGQVSAATPITISNTSDNAITVSPSLTGTGASQFGIVTDTCGTVLASGVSCTISVVSRPSQPGAASATLNLGGVGNGNNATIPLSGEGVGPAVSFNPTSVAFGTQAVGTATAARTVTVTNTGNSPLSVSSVSLNGDVRDFALRSQNCTAAPIAPGASCEASVAFDPISPGAKTAHLHLVDNARSGSQQVALTGTGAPAHLALSATTLNFPSTVIGLTSPTQTLTVRSNGEAPLTISSLALSGSSTRAFVISSQNCTGAPVAPGATCTVSLRFAPLSPGAQSAILHVNSNSHGGQSTVNLAGNGARGVAGAVFGPARRGFGTVRVGRRSRIQTINVRSSGSAPLTVRRLRLSGPNRTQFRVRSQTCTGATFAPGRRCRIRLSFRPASTGLKRATLTISDTAPTAGRIALRGRGR